jgi:4-amino-4-deoxy-L-arabinose transferase-like glycosyltransferase
MYLGATTGAARRRWVAPLALSFVALVLYLPSIGDADFVGDDEALDAGVVVEMTRTGDWLFPEFNGEYLPPKPPLFYWAAATVADLRGAADETAIRIPSALAAAALVGLTAYAAAPGGGAAGVVAGAILLTMPVVRDQARAGRCDMMLALLVAASLFIARRGAEAAASRAVFAVLLGLAAITKGGAGVGIVVATLLVFALAERSARPLQIFVDPAVVLVIVIVSGTWYTLGTWHWGRRFVDEQIVGENLHHLFGGTAISDRDPGTRSFAYHVTYYAIQLFATMLPWSFLLPAAVFEAWRRHANDRDALFDLAWIAGGFLLLTSAARKSPYYVLPLTPAVAAVASRWLAPRIEWSTTSVRTLPPSLAAAGLAIAVGFWIACRAATFGGCQVQGVLGTAAARPLATIGATWVLVVSLGSVVFALTRRDIALGFAATASALAGLWLFVGQVEGPIAQCTSLKPFARAVRSEVPEGAPLFFFRDPLPVVALYSGRRIPTLQPSDTPPPESFLIVPESLAPDVPKAWIARQRIVAEGRGRVFTRRAMGIRLIALGGRPPEPT